MLRDSLLFCTQPSQQGPLLTLPASLLLKVDKFADVRDENPEAMLKLDADGHLIEMTPTGGEI